MKEHYIEHLKFSACIQKDVEVISVIRTRLLRKGEGVKDDPIRRITQYWSLDGELLWEHDPLGKESLVRYHQDEKVTIWNKPKKKRGAKKKK